MSSRWHRCFGPFTAVDAGICENDAMAEAAVSVRRPSLLAISRVFARYANLTWGGGSATIAVIHDQIVTTRSWISELEFNLAFALSRLTPGTNLLAFCTAAGWLARRWPGAIVTLLASSLPCAVMAVIVTHFYELWQQNAIVLSALRGALASAVAVMVYTAWHLSNAHIRAEPIRAAVVVPGAVALTTWGGWSPVRVLLLAAAIGLIWPAREVAKKAS
jgi:chromate transporter